MGDNTLKEVASILFVGFLWAAFIVYSDQFLAIYSGNHEDTTAIIIYSFIIIFTVLGLVAVLIQDMVTVIVFIVLYTIIYIVNAIYLFEELHWLIAVCMGAITVFFAVMLAVNLGD